MHREPGSAWHLATLAELAHLSRSSFAERFSRVVGCPPLEYLSRWRMQVAARRLGDRRLSLARAAEQVGYTSEFAFAKAFKRVTGRTPGVYRRSLRTAGEPAAETRPTPPR